MTSLTRKSLSFLTLCAIGLPLAAFVVGCKKKAPPPPPPPPPPPAPTTVDPQNVAQYLTLDPKVSLQNAKPMDCSEDEVKAILQFMSNFASGNSDALRGSMDSTGRKVLDELVESGKWKEETSKIVEVDLVDRVSLPIGGNVVTFSVIMPQAGRVQQDWLVTQRGDTYTFAPYAVMPMSKQAMDAALKSIQDAAGANGQQNGNQPDDDRDHNKDPRKFIPKPPDTPSEQPEKAPAPGPGTG